MGFIACGLFLFENGAMYRKFNPNPAGKAVGDCTVRAMCGLFGIDWLTAYDELCAEGRTLFDLPSSNAVWGSYLYLQGYDKHMIFNRRDHIMTVREFAEHHPKGTYLLATGSHVVTVKNGDYYDTWDSGDEVPIYYWEKGYGL